MPSGELVQKNTQTDLLQAALGGRPHVCLVSQQTLPNLLPLLWERIKPSELILCVTPPMEERARILERFAKKIGMPVSLLALPNGDPVPVGNVISSAIEKYIEDGLAINVTGGTKLMALAALEVAKESNSPAFYIDTERGKCVLLSTSHLREEDLPELVKITDIFEANGYVVQKVDRSAVAIGIRLLIAEIMDGFDTFLPILGQFNAFAYKAKNALNHVLSLEGWPKSGPFVDLLNLYHKAQVLDIANEVVAFRSAVDCDLACGGWLEAYARSVLYRLKANKFGNDHASNIVVTNGQGVKNEIDAALTCRNRLFLIECKTSKMSDMEKDDDVSYKLDTLTDVLGGGMASAMLVSCQPLSSSRLRRCREYKIQVVHGREVKSLEERVIKWLKP